MDAIPYFPSLPLLWFLLGTAFLIAELFIPGIILIFFTAGCWIVGLTLIFIDIEPMIQFLVFIFSSLILLFSIRRYALKAFRGTTGKETGDDIDQSHSNGKIGKTAIVTKTITANGSGEIKFMGSFWMTTATTVIEKGESVVVVSKEETNELAFKVKPLPRE